MKNKKLLKALAAITMGAVMAVGSFSLAACGGKKPDDKPDQDQTQTGGNENGGNENQNPSGGNTTAAPTFADYVAKGADDINDDPSVPTYPDESGTPAQVAAPKVVAHTGNGAALVEGNIETSYEFDAANLSTKVYADGWTDGIFSVLAGTEVRGRIKTNTIYDGSTATAIEYTTANSVKLDTAAHGLSVKISAPGELVLYVLNGSGSASSENYLAIGRPNGSSVTDKVTFPANGNSSNIQLVKLNLDVAGEYSITRSGSWTSDIYYAKFTNTVVNTAIASISMADTGKIDYFVGQQLDCTGIAVTATHKTTGRISTVAAENLVIDTSKYDATKAGTYEIGVSYTVDENLDDDTTTFTTSYNVNVYAFEDFELSYNKIVKESKNSAAGNGVYANHAVKQFYFKGDALSYDGLSIKATGKLGSATKTFGLDETQAVVTGDANTVGKQTIKVSYTANGLTKAKGFNIYVAEKPAELATVNTILLAVNPQFSTATIGTKNAAGAYRFKTIQQAIDFLNASGAKESAEKIVYIAEGTYWEKLEVTVPNVTFVGAGESKTKIEYDALYGEVDAGGFTHTTDSTATLNVRDTAVGFKMSNITVSNYYNTLASYSNANSNDKRALAALIQADKVVIENCTFLGFQDTIELFTGRQLFVNCLISGSTDYIFGTNNTTYFYKCELRTVKNGSNGGYVTAFKGLNKGHGTDDIKYGAIFDDCDFTAENDVPDGAGSLGRAWGIDAAVMIMNSRIGKHISKTGATNTGGRYISMGNGDPAGAQFVEYNNTGDGAITATLATVKVLAAAEAANYSNLAVIFGKTNGNVTYEDAWNITLD